MAVRLRDSQSRRRPGGIPHSPWPHILISFQFILSCCHIVMSSCTWFLTSTNIISSMYPHIKTTARGSTIAKSGDVEGGIPHSPSYCHIPSLLYLCIIILSCPHVLIPLYPHIHKPVYILLSLYPHIQMAAKGFHDSQSRRCPGGISMLCTTYMINTHGSHSSLL